MSNLANPDLADPNLDDPNLADPDLGGGALLVLADGTFSRGFEAYALGSDSLLDLYAANELRTEYRSDLGLYLLEGERMNLLTRSEEFDHADWDGPDNATVTANTDVAPDGNQTADTVADDDGGRFEKRTQSATIVSGSTYTFSIFVKKDNDESRFPEFQNADGTGSSNLQLNTKTGDTTFRTNTLSATASVDSVSDWWRLSVTFTASGTTYAQRLHPAVTTTFGSTEASATGSIVVWGARLEEGSFPTSYIKTTTAAATRAADTLTFASGDIPNRVLSGAFTQQFRPYAASADLSSGDEQWLLSVGGSSDGIRLRHDGSDVLLEYLRAGSVITASAALTYSRHQLMSYTLDHSTGDLTVSGATSGDGTTTGTSGSWTAATMRVAGVQGGANEAYMGLGDLEKAA